MSVRLAFVGIAATCATIVSGGEPTLQFAGFTAETPLDELRIRYPKSRVLDGYIHVAAEESTDHIYGIAFSEERVLLIFERKSMDGRSEYPLCDDVYDHIHGAYGDPDAVQNFREETMKVQNRTWRRGHERMLLRCFWRAEVEYAERLELFKASDSARSNNALGGIDISGQKKERESRNSNGLGTVQD